MSLDRLYASELIFHILDPINEHLRWPLIVNFTTSFQRIPPLWLVDRDIMLSKKKRTTKDKDADNNDHDGTIFVAMFTGEADDRTECIPC